MTGTYKAYRQTAAEANDGLGPLIALFDTLAGNLHRAACAQRDNDIATRCDEARHALLVIGFLEDWVARGAEGELAAGLKAFYDSLRRAVIAAGTVLTGSTPIYDLPNERIIRPATGEPLVVPEGAVVVPGARAVTVGAGREWGLSLATPVIVKYRDDRTDTRTELEAWIR